MRQLLILLLVCATTLVACTKPVEELTASRSQEDDTKQIVVDFSAFPAHTIFTLTHESNNMVYRFDSDSAAYFISHVVEGNYHAKWQILGIKEDGRYKAKMVNQNQGTVADWKPVTIQINAHQLSGIYTFTRVNR